MNNLVQIGMYYHTIHMIPIHTFLHFGDTRKDSTNLIQIHIKVSSNSKKILNKKMISPITPGCCGKAEDVS